MFENYVVKYLGGIALYPEANEGVLTINDRTLEFKGHRLTFHIPIEQIVNIVTAEADDLKKAAGSYLALGMVGLAATRSMSKVRLMKVTFRDTMGGLQSPEFRFLPRSIKEVNFYQQAANELNRLRENVIISPSISQPQSNNQLIQAQTRTTPKIEEAKTIEAQSLPPTNTPKSHRSRNIIIGIIVGILIVTMINALMFNNTPKLSINNTPKISITGLNLQIQYNDSDQAYFGPDSQSIAISNQPNQLLQVNQGQQFFLSFQFTESALAIGSHSIDDFTATTHGFTVVSVDPPLPIRMSPGDKVMITITFQAPQSTFNGAIDVALSTDS